MRTLLNDLLGKNITKNTVLINANLNFEYLSVQQIKTKRLANMDKQTEILTRSVRQLRINKN